MDKAAADYMDMVDVLKRGDPEELELAASLVDGFPGGRDGYIGGLWIDEALAYGALSSIRWMIDRGAKLSYRAEDGYTPLHTVIERDTHDKYEVLEFLIAAGADPNTRGINDWTPLHMAAVRDDWKALGMLLDAGADPTIKTRIDNYATPEEEARQLGHTRSAEILRDYGT